MPFEIRHFVATNLYLRKDRSTHSISIISMVPPQARIVRHIVGELFCLPNLLVIVTVML